MHRIAAIFLLLTLSFSVKADVSAKKLDLNQLWFKPFLVKNNDVVCKDLLSEVQTKFLSKLNFKKSFKVNDKMAILDWKNLSGGQLKQLQAYNKTFYIDNYEIVGCSSYCSTNQLLVRSEPFPKNQDYAFRHNLAKNSPPAASYDYSLFESNEQIPYVFIIGDNNEYQGKILLYKLNVDAKWQSACEISVKPKEQKNTNNEEQARVLKSISAFNQTIIGLSRGAGECGSYGIYNPWQYRLSEQLKKTLYRPWAMSNSTKESKNSFGDYERIIKSLKQWSLTGLSEHAALKAYNKQLKLTIIELSKFYQFNYGWTENTSLSMAKFSLTAAVSQGFGFYMYDTSFSKNEDKLRQLILDGKGSKSINSLNFEALKVDALISNRVRNEARESVLNIAIKNPDALKVLLEKSINPNVQNEFGKTPLMYAAQYNQIESAKLLIKYGANTLATTTNKGLDSCYYNLKMSNVTALHYAVRYASTEFIRLLLDNGAELFMTAENGNEYPKSEETALDWFYRYTAENSAEKNSNIKSDDFQLIEKWLQPPSKEQLSLKLKKSIVDAERFYHKSKIQKSYSLLLKALAIEPNNDRALSNMALVALKMNKLGESLAASEKLIKHSMVKKIIANAWFNKGLACEKFVLSGMQRHPKYNGRYHCFKPFLNSYLQAWITDKTSARKNKLITVFKTAKTNVCKVVTPENDEYQFHFAKKNQKDLIYFFHKKNVVLSAADIFKQVNFFDVNKGMNRFPINYSPKYMASYDLGEYVVDEMMSPYGNGYPIWLGELSCRLKQ